MVRQIKRPTNTQRELTEEPPARMMAMYLAPNSIETSERRGQVEMVESDVLPVDSHDCDDSFLALGFKFGEPFADDPIFRPATLPEGWRREASEHAMWSYIVDERSIRRVAVFYKAAFYDRSAHMRAINVGREVAGNAIYGDHFPSRDSLRLDSFSPSEVAEFRAELDRAAAKAAEGPGTYGDCQARIDQLRKYLK